MDAEFAKDRVSRWGDCGGVRVAALFTLAGEQRMTGRRGKAGFALFGLELGEQVVSGDDGDEAPDAAGEVFVGRDQGVCLQLGEGDIFGVVG